MFTLTIDDRERRSAVPDALAAAGAFEIDFRRLPVGDYLLDSALLFERKTLVDLVASIKEGRLFSQALRLAEARLPAALILEGTSADLAGSGMRWEAIQGALVTVSLFIGLPVLRTRTAVETAQTLLFAARQRIAVAHGALARRGHRPKGKAALQRYMLQGLPGVGPQRAGRLLECFGSVAGVVNADAAALAAVKGIGKRTASRIRWSVEEARAPYGAGDAGSAGFASEPRPGRRLPQSREWMISLLTQNDIVRVAPGIARAGASACTSVGTAISPRRFLGVTIHEDWTQRSMPLRQWQEVQAVLPRGRGRGRAGAGESCVEARAAGAGRFQCRRPDDSVHRGGLWPGRSRGSVD